MSERPPVYIRCASGNDSHADCRVEFRGDLATLTGPSPMQFAPNDAVVLADTLLAGTDQPFGQCHDLLSVLRSRIAMTLHVVCISDDLARVVLGEVADELRIFEQDLAYWVRSAERWRALYVQEAALRDAEIDDGK
jgi:hypothetical protein